MENPLHKQPESIPPSRRRLLASALAVVTVAGIPEPPAAQNEKAPNLREQKDFLRSARESIVNFNELYGVWLAVYKLLLEDFDPTNERYRGETTLIKEYPDYADMLVVLSSLQAVHEQFAQQRDQLVSDLGDANNQDNMSDWAKATLSLQAINVSLQILQKLVNEAERIEGMREYIDRKLEEENPEGSKNLTTEA